MLLDIKEGRVCVGGVRAGEWFRCALRHRRVSRGSVGVSARRGESPCFYVRRATASCCVSVPQPGCLDSSTQRCSASWWRCSLEIQHRQEDQSQTCTPPRRDGCPAHKHNNPPSRLQPKELKLKYHPGRERTVHVSAKKHSSSAPVIVSTS